MRIARTNGRIRDPQRSRRFESESLVVLRESEKQHERQPGHIRSTKQFIHEGRPDALILSTGRNRKRRNSHNGTITEVTNRSKNVTDDPRTFKSNQIEPFDFRIAGPGVPNDGDLFAPVSAAGAEGLLHDADDRLAFSHVGRSH